MTFDGLRKRPLPRTLAELLGDFADLVSKQIQLARAEITANLSSALFASAWVIVAALLFLLAGVLLIEGAVFTLASWESRSTGHVALWRPSWRSLELGYSCTRAPQPRMH